MNTTPSQTLFSVDDMAAHAEEATRLLKALSNPHRLMVLCLLVEGERSVGELLDSVSLSQSALSQHLATLRRDKLVRTRREAQTIYYALAEPRAERVVSLLHEIYCDGR